MQQRNIVARDFYVYSVPFGAVASLESKTAAINIEADSDFEVQKLTTTSQGALGYDGNPEATVTILDTGAGRNLMNTAIPLTSLFGTGELPFILPTPKLFLARSTISLTLTNYGGDDMDEIWLNFIGRKIFYGSAPASLPPQPMG